MELKDVVRRIKRCMELEDRKDVEFRALIALTELGDIVKFVTHDPRLNPGARPHGTPKDEVLAYGQALVQTIAALQLRGVDLEEALETGLQNWEDADWRRRQARANGAKKLKGIGVVAGKITGRIYVISDEHPLSEVPDGAILVSEFAKSDLVQYMLKVVAIITNHGGKTCHAANVARDPKWQTICMVGTGNATEVLEHGKRIHLNIPQVGNDVEAEITIESG